jgi:hypothetical protein
MAENWKVINALSGIWTQILLIWKGGICRLKKTAQVVDEIVDRQTGGVFFS